MVKVTTELTIEEVVEMIANLALLEVYCPEVAPRARQKLKLALKDAIGQLEHEAFSKACDEYLKKDIEKLKSDGKTD